MLPYRSNQEDVSYTSSLSWFEMVRVGWKAEILKAYRVEGMTSCTARSMELGLFLLLVVVLVGGSFELAFGLGELAAGVTLLLGLSAILTHEFFAVLAILRERCVQELTKAEPQKKLPVSRSCDR